MAQRENISISILWYNLQKYFTAFVVKKKTIEQDVLLLCTFNNLSCCYLNQQSNDNRIKVLWWYYATFFICMVMNKWYDKMSDLVFVTAWRSDDDNVAFTSFNLHTYVCLSYWVFRRRRYPQTCVGTSGLALWGCLGSICSPETETGSVINTYRKHILKHFHAS